MKKTGLLLLLLLALLLRLHGLDRFGSVGDEKNVSIAVSLLDGVPEGEFHASSLQQHRDFGNLTKHCAYFESGNTLAYLLLLLPWSELFGYTDYALRAFSAFVSLGSVWLTYSLLAMSRLERGREIGLWTGFILAVHPTLIQSAQAARAYQLALFFALLSTWLLCRWFRERKGGVLLAYGFVSGLLLLTHYLAVTVLAGHLVFVLFSDVTRTNRADLRRFILVPVPLALLMLSAWLFLGKGAEGLRHMSERNAAISQASESADIGYRHWFQKPTPKNIVSWGYQAVNSNLGLYGLQALGLRLLVYSPLVVSLTLMAVWGARETIRTGDPVAKLIPVLALSHFVFALSITLLSSHMTAFLQSYFIWTIPFWIVLVGVGLYSPSANRGVLALKNLVVLLWLLGIGAQLFCDSNPRSEKYPEGRPRNAYAVLLDEVVAEQPRLQKVWFQKWQFALLLAIQANLRDTVPFEVREQPCDVELEFTDGTTKCYLFHGNAPSRLIDGQSTHQGGR